MTSTLLEYCSSCHWWWFARVCGRIVNDFFLCVCGYRYRIIKFIRTHTAMLTLAKLTQKNVLKIAETTGVPQLLTIPYSHYVEFARWSLDHHRVEHEERPYAPVQHVLPMLKLRSVTTIVPPLAAQLSLIRI